jgi:endonuclease/exonuclease/phosphatase family metal-dependent hydrolase
LPGTLRVLTYNVHSCIGLDGEVSPERIARVISEHEPDVVALQELDVARRRTAGVDQAHVIAERLEMLLHFRPVVSVGEEQYGDAVLSRLRMRVVRAAALPRLPASRVEPRGALWVEIDAPTGRVQLINTHLSLHPLERRIEADALLGPDWLGAVDAGEAVLCGDFNALSWFPVCRRITRRLCDVQAGRPGRRPRTTWQGGLGLGRIDHVFVDPAIEVAAVRVVDDRLARVASDHLPLIVDLRLPDRR